MIDPLSIECRRCGAAVGQSCRTPSGTGITPHKKRRGEPGWQRSRGGQLTEARDTARKWRNKEKRARLKIKELEAAVRKLEAELAELRSDPAPVQRKLHGNAAWRALGEARR